MNRDPIEEKGHDLLKGRSRHVYLWADLLRLQSLFACSDAKTVLDGKLSIEKVLTDPGSVAKLRSALVTMESISKELFTLAPSIPASAGDAYRFVHNSSLTAYDLLGEEPVTIACVILSFLAGYGVGDALYDLGEDVVEAQDAVEKASKAREDMIDDPSNENIQSFQKETKEAIDKVDDAAKSGAQIPGTGMKGPPPTPVESGVDVTTDLIGRGLEKLNETEGD